MSKWEFWMLVHFILISPDLGQKMRFFCAFVAMAMATATFVSDYFI